MPIGWKEVDDAMGRLEQVLRPRVGKKMTALSLRNLVALKEQGCDATNVLSAIHSTLDAFARIPESGTPFPLGVAKANGDVGCLNLTTLNWKMRGAPTAENLALAMREDEARAVAVHADALIPAYGEDDAEFAARVAWKSSHHFRQRLVVGRATNRNDPTPSVELFDAWQRQGARGVPIGVVTRAMERPGVIYALGPEPSASVLERFVPTGFVFSPDDGDNVDLTTWTGLQRFFALVPLRITPRTLAWIVHLTRLVAGPVAVDVDDSSGGGLTVEWESKEEEPFAQAASVLLGVPAEKLDERAAVTMRAGTTTLRYAPGELDVLGEGVTGAPTP